MAERDPESQRSSPRRASQSVIPTRTLYDVLGVSKEATDDDIKRAYRKLALRYHPDKNLDNDPAKTEMFKEINHANAVLSDPQKRKMYDVYGDMGLKMMDQFGDGFTKYALKPWLKWLILAVACFTGGCFCCCCCCFCCCNFCCGKCVPKNDDTAYGPPSQEWFSRNRHFIIMYYSCRIINTG